ncbi:Transcription regulator [Fulvivirga imtechensis AK7]|uniref:Transcription regulator n=2 Tax=Fulvivirga TaxID=396811 RepID=L8JXR8_9BACT|nr:Transcription regulator [Fulvivirga imtechensis AK7]
MAERKKRSALFIVNPHSGTKGKDHIPALLNKYLDPTIFEWDVIFTQYAGEARELSNAGKEKYDLIVATGGDGTINEIARPLLHSKAVLGIIPCGSGNGLARHLGIPLNQKKAIQLLNEQHMMVIDTIKLDSDIFLNVAGVGFDAHIAQSFASSKKRGFISYAMIALREIRQFRCTDYQLTIDGEQKIENASFLVSIANSSQFGNNAHIAPTARIADGLMDICILRDFPFWYYPILIYRLFTGRLKNSKYYQCWQGKEALIKISNDSDEKFIHLDGDPYPVKNIINFSIDPLSLQVACKPASDR